MSELREALLGELADMLDAEQQMSKALKKVEEAATAGELKSALEEHKRATEEQVGRLKQVFKKLGQPARTKTCHAMQGLVQEANERIENDAGDAALISVLQKMEHYEIASYGTLRSWASLLEEVSAAELLGDILDAERSFDEQLTELAESTINIEAAEDEAVGDS